MRGALFLLASAALAACSPSEPQPEPDVEANNATIEQVAEEVREATKEPGFIRPGKWLSEITMEDVSAPGMPDEVREQMKGMMAGRQSYESCLTPEQANRPQEDFFSGKPSEQCRYDHFRMGDGKIDAKMSCSGGKQVMELDGAYTPESYKMRMTTTARQAPGGDMTMRMRIDAKRVGECDGKRA